MTTLTQPADWYIGYCLYVDDHMLDACANEEQRNGFAYARNGQIAADIFEIALETGYDEQYAIERDITQTQNEIRLGVY